MPIRFSLPDRQSSTSDALVAFDRNGQLLWKFVPTESMQCGTKSFGAPWRVSAITVAQDVTHPRVWIAYDHHTWWPSLLFEIDAAGHATLRYMQIGWIRALAEWQSPHGHFLAVGGVLNEFEQPSAAILDLNAPPATTPHGSPKFGCQGTPAGTPEKVFRFPNLDLIGATASTYAMATRAKTLSDGLEIELGEGGGGALIELDNEQRVRSFSLADHYWSEHRALEARGLMTHTADNCPERTRPQSIDEWTAATGWTRFTIVPTISQTVRR